MSEVIVVPFSRELFIEQPEAAKEFLALLESKSKGLLPDWSGWSEDEIVQEAINRLEEIDEDLQRVDWLKKFGRLH